MPSRTMTQTPLTSNPFQVAQGGSSGLLGGSRTLTAPPPQPPAAPSLRTPQAAPTGLASAFTQGTSSASSAPLGNYSIAPPTTPPPLQSPGNNLVNPGYTEQALEHTQNRLLEDPFSGALQNQLQQSQSPTQGEQYLNQNLGTLDGPGQGDQYWNQVQGQFNDPFAGEQFARQQAQAMSPTGPAGAFFNQAMGQYGDMTNYGGGNQAQGQFQQNAASGPLAGQQFYNQVQGDYGTTGTYSDPNLAAGQYAQTQQAFGDLPIANFDPFYDRARQLATQDYNRQAAGRGVYGSSEALSGVGNVITDIEAQRANRAFDAEMQRAIEQRQRQGLLGEQARMGDVSSLAAFGANLAGLESFGNLANQAGQQTLGQQTMLGQQARQADLTGLDTFEAERRGVETFGNLAGQADTAETNRFSATTNAMNQADRTGLERLGLGADIAFRGDDSARADFDSQNRAAATAAGLDLDRQRLGVDIAGQGSAQDLARLNSFMNASTMAENSRQGRLGAQLDAVSDYTGDVQQTVSQGLEIARSGDQAAWEDYVTTTLAPYLQAAGYEQQEIDNMRQNAQLFIDAAGVVVGAAGGGKK